MVDNFVIHFEVLSSIAKTFESSVPTGDTILRGYERVHVAATFGFSSDLNLLFSVDNLFDGACQEGISFPSPGT